MTLERTDLLNFAGVGVVAELLLQTIKILRQVCGEDRECVNVLLEQGKPLLGRALFHIAEMDRPGQHAFLKGCLEEFQLSLNPPRNSLAKRQFRPIQEPE